jgi:hypothetical protein
MLTATPTNWSIWNFAISDEGDNEIAQVTTGWFTGSANIEVDGVSYTASRQGIFGDFVLDLNGEILISAKKPSAFSRSFTVSFGGREYILEAESAVSRRFILFDGDNEIGSIDPENMMTTDASIHLPEDLPHFAQTFIFFLAMILWKRGNNSAAQF